MTTSAHNRKRAARFEAAGIDVADLACADTEYLDDMGGACCLCDTAIKYRFSLRFANRPGGAEPVVLEPVGSQCITDWMKALPACPEVDAALAKVKKAERRRDRLVREKKQADRRRQAQESALSEMGQEDAALMRRYFAVLNGGKAKGLGGDYDTLKDIGDRAERARRFRSDKQRRFFYVLVGKAEKEARKHMTAAEREQAVVDTVRGSNPEHGDLVARYYALPAGARNPECVDIMTGGTGGVARYGSFRSARQAGFFAARIREDEARLRGPDEAAPATTNGNSDPLSGVAQADSMEDFPFA